jgi:hypothetical protein
VPPAFNLTNGGLYDDLSISDLHEPSAHEDDLSSWFGIAAHPPDCFIGATPAAVDRSPSSIVIDVSETLHSQCERGRVHAQGRTDDRSDCTLLVHTVVGMLVATPPRALGRTYCDSP